MDPRGYDGGGYGQSDDFMRRKQHTPPDLRRGTSGDSSSVRLPPLPRPPSAEDINAARQHLVLLKSKMPQRFRDRSAGPAPRSASPSRQSQRGRSMPPRPGPEDSPHSQRERSQPRRSQHGQEISTGTQKQRRSSRDTGSPQVYNQEQPMHQRAPENDPFGQSGRSQEPAMHRSASRSDQFSPHGQRQEQPMQHQMQQQMQQPRHHQPMHQQPMQHAAPRDGQSGYGPTAAFQSPPHAAPPTAFGQNASGDVEEASELVKCEDCGRSFNPDAIERHRRICKKVFGEKRKQFNSAANRLGDLENAGALIQNAKKIEKEVEQVKKKEEQKKDEPPPAAAAAAPDAKNGKPLPKWKQQSLAFRAAMLASKAATGDAEAAQKMEAVKEEMGDPPPDPNKTTCPHCGRSFNKESAQRHIDICLKTFGSKPGGGRLVRGGGKSCNQTADVRNKPQPTASQPQAAAKAGGRGPGRDGEPPGRRVSGAGAGTRVASQGALPRDGDGRRGLR